ncbi:M23 family metallopeptidase [Rathayibacter sp. YIM 133350]|uniref:M23 family metallopeptidase n=1 Tax=Rathayibacter sp. YIM 133350 TaxID=3131992 RepID=UPI00307F461F
MRAHRPLPRLRPTGFVPLTALVLLLSGGGAPTAVVGAWAATPQGGHAPAALVGRWPLSAPVRIVQEFRAPASRYAAGHRGVDFAATAGAPVFAVADGVVSFAGTVVDRPLLSLDHGGGVISSIEPVTASVAAGERVTRGQQVGVVDSGGHCGSTCLHLGVRVHGEYASPRLLIGPLQRAVLLPVR